VNFPYTYNCPCKPRKPPSPSIDPMAAIAAATGGGGGACLAVLAEGSSKVWLPLARCGEGWRQHSRKEDGEVEGTRRG
jgi:hypothetical protein